MNRIYCAIGKIMEITQDIEELVGYICKNSEIIKEFGRNKNMTKADLAQVEDDSEYLREKMQTMTFGAMISIIYESRSLSHEEINQLKALLEKRNYFVHEYFKVTKFDINPKEEDVLDEFGALKNYLSTLKQMQNRLEIIKSGQEERLNYLISKVVCWGNKWIKNILKKGLKSLKKN